TPGYSYLSLLYSPLSAFTQGCIVVMRYIRLCIISLLATLPREHKKYWGSVSYAAIAGPFPSL
ncbi:hypothetical protein, partial [Escherichia coli]|uniref:hypothetical protein n=1 Tax=Escherichia coli TaxID=562 RepID=UPI0021C20174